MIRYVLIFISFFLFLHFSCRNNIDKNTINNEPVLAIIKDRIITVNDFIKRCEYSPRPSYCKGQYYIHKKIALNSLIAEKILSIEFEDLKLKLNEQQYSLIQGRQEQAMRQLMLKNFGFDLVKIDTVAIKDMVALRNREYTISFAKFNIEQKNAMPDFNSLFDAGSNINTNEMKIGFTDEMIDAVRWILYKTGPEKDVIYGPYEISDSTFLALKVLHWEVSVDVTEKEKTDTWNLVEKEYIEEKALKKFSKYVSEIMKGKKIEFNDQIFSFFSDKIADIYLIEKSKKEKIVQGVLWDKEVDTQIKNFSRIDAIKDKIILNHEGQEWTVKQLISLIKKHPLVFRKKKINPDHFDNELKLSIADLLRDKHITERAYQLGFDSNKDIMQVKQKWKDYLQAAVVKHRYLQSNKTSKSLENSKTPDRRIISIIDSLQAAYSDQINIDTERFEKIKLSSIDLFARYSNQPFVDLEPAFPVLTDDHLLDYGNRLLDDE